MTDYQTLLHRLNDLVTTLLSTDDKGTYDASILLGLEYIGKSFAADRVQMWQNEVINNELHFVHRLQWLSDLGETKPPVPIGLAFPYRSMPHWEELFLKHEHINSPF